MEADQPHSLDMAENTSESDAPRIQVCDDVTTESKGENGEGASGEDQGPRPRKRKDNNRHTQLQVEEMEVYFKKCPNPDAEQRKALSQYLGLTPSQVQYWFSNKRANLKAQHERFENAQLRAENERLRAENMMYSEALKDDLCSDCGGRSAIGEMSFNEQQLRLENARLIEEFDRLSAIAAKCTGEPVVRYPFVSPSYVPLPPPQPMIGVHYGSISGIKPIIAELVRGALKELIVMARTGESPWFTTIDGSTTVLNENEYNKHFPQLIGPKPTDFKREFSRETAIVFMNQIHLIDIFMDVNKWSKVFSSIISGAMTSEVLSTGVHGSYDGAVQVMAAEFQIPSSFMPTRGSNFVRCCKKLLDGIWAIVDVSLGELQPKSSVMRCRKKPSGCIIQQLSNGYSKVKWIEHVEVEEKGVHILLKQLVNSGHAFGAKRWTSTLYRQCERLALTMVPSLPALDAGVINPVGRKYVLILAERMVRSFCAGVSACSEHSWKNLNGIHGLRVMACGSVNNPGRPGGLVLYVTTSFRLPYSPKRLFEFLCNKNFRNEWDLLCKGATVIEPTHITTGRTSGSRVSALRLVDGHIPEQANMSILQETWEDSAGSYLIFAPIDVAEMNALLGGIVDPNFSPILPSGFAILPDGTTANAGGIGETTNGGSILTVANQLLIHSAPKARVSVKMVAGVSDIVIFTIENLKKALSRHVT